MAQSNVDTDHTNKTTLAGMQRRRAYRTKGIVSELRAADRVLKGLNQPIWEFTYKIPVVFNSECPNPSRLLWAAGAFRLDEDGSVWIALDETMESQVVKDLRAYWSSVPPKEVRVKKRLEIQKVVHNAVRYHDSQVHIIKAMAQTALMGKIDKANHSLCDSMESAEEIYKKAEKAIQAQCAKYKRNMTAQEAGQIEYQRYLNSKNALDTAKESLDSVMRCICLFEMEECQDIQKLIEALKASLVANEAVVAAMKAAKE